MKLLAVASEMHPLVKTGGLADVVGALPMALAPLGVEVTTLLPGYPRALARLPGARTVKRYGELFGCPARLLAGRLDGASGAMRLLLLDAPLLFDREGDPYGDGHGGDWPDNWRRFAALSAVAADIAAGGVRGQHPALVHAHDWQAAMTPAYMRHGAAAHVPAVLTLHNMAFQGRFPAHIFPELGLPQHLYAIDGVEYYGGVGYLKAGINHADAITTVSPTYAREILTPEFGMGLSGLLRAHANVLHGIVNGIDAGEWDPATDPMIPATYDAGRLPRRAANKKAVAEHFGLDDDNSPLFIAISRLTWQKGMDLLAEAGDFIVARGARLAILGAGDPALEAAIAAAAARHPGRIGALFGYNEPLSHRMQAGGDAILIPSRFEPCGLTQLYGLRYGCVPVVAQTGGLADTVIDANVAALGAGVATGFQFAPGHTDMLCAGIERALDIYAARPAWTRIQQQGMAADFSWNASARRYKALYASLIHTRKAI